MRSLLVFSILFLAFSAKATVPQVVPIPEDQSLSPQIEFAGVGIGTLNYSKNAEHGSEAGFNVSDSALLFGASELTGREFCYHLLC